MEKEEVLSFVDGCIHDASAPCACACPFRLDVRAFLKKCAKGRVPAAYKDYRTAVIFPRVVSALCPAKCRERCQRKLLGDEPLDMQAIERAVVRLAGAQEPVIYPIQPKDTPIAVVGAGPAGLSFALGMAQKKYPVTVFEKASDLGGALRSHPEFPDFEADIRAQLAGEKLELRFDTEIRSLDALGEYALVYIATGRGGADFGLRESWEPRGFSTKNPKVLLGGGLCGIDTVQAIADSLTLGRIAENLMMTGRAEDPQPALSCPDHRLFPEDTAPAAHVAPADEAAGYTKDELKAEAGRCMLCKCERCVKDCPVLAKYNKPPVQMAMEVLADSGAHFLASRTMTRETYSCTECGRCGADCPEKLDMGELFHFSKLARARDGIAPEALHDFWMRELDFTMNEGFLAAAPEPGSALAFFPGCRLSASLPEQTLAAARYLREKHGAGVILGCCGAGAWWAGEQETLEKNSALIRCAWEDMGCPTLALACESCGKMLRRTLPEIPTVSLYTVLAEDGVRLPEVYPAATVFDPCAAREDMAAKAAVRRLTSESGCALTELPKREQGWCCGWGGHIRTANPAMYDKIASERAAAGEQPYLVYCANCREVFREKGKDCRHILEALFGICGQDYTIQEKRDNQRAVKQTLAREVLKEEAAVEKKPWDDLQIVVPPEKRRDMEEQLISDGDVRECIYAAEQSGQRFTDGQGLSLACLRRRVMTYWVEYRTQGDRYEIADAYCHRMRFETEAQA